MHRAGGVGARTQNADLLLRVTVKSAEMRDLAWLPGERDDVPALMQGFDVFALPSQAEGVSNTLLEAMSTGLPIACV